MNQFFIFKQIEPNTAVKPFRIVEQYNTSDGYRWRMTEHCYKFLDNAKAAIKVYRETGRWYAQ